MLRLSWRSPLHARIGMCRSSRLVPVFTLVATVAIVAASPTQAQTLNWDANGTLPVNGNDTVTPGNNVWDTTNLRWYNGASYQAWNNAALSDAVFAGTAGTVTLGVPITAHNLTFSSNNYVLGGSALTLGGVNPTITVNTTTSTINSIIGGTSGLIKSGTGTLVLSAANTYSGVTVLQSGTLSLTNNAALGIGPNIASNFVISNGTTLNFNSTTIDRNFTLNGGIARMSAAAAGVYSGSPTLTASTELQLISSGTFSGNFADSGANVLSLSKTVSGTVILSGTNTYSGATLVSAGILRVTSAGALSANSNLNLTGGGVLELGAADLTRSLGTGANQVRWTGNGGLAAFGATRIVNLGGAFATLTWATPNFVGAGQTLILASASATGMLDWQNPINLNGAVRTVQINNGSAATDVTLSGALSNGGVIYTGTGTVLASAANTYTGGTSLNGATVRVNTIGNGGTAGGLGAASSTAANLVFDNNTSILTYAGTGESTDRNFSFGAATQAQIAASGTGVLVWNGTAATASGARTLVLRGTNTGSNIFAGTLSDGGGTLSLTKSDAGTWRLTGANTYTGTTQVTGGTLEVDSLADGGVASSIGASNAAASLLINNSGLRYVGSANASTNRNFTGIATPRIESSGAGTLTWNGTMVTTAAANLTLGGTNTGNNLFAGVLTDFNTAGALRTGLIKAGTGNWALSGASTYTGDTRIDAGLLTLNSAAALSGGLAGDGATQGSLLVLNGGVVGLTTASGDFNRAVGTTQFVDQVRWQGAGGFAAFGGDRVVNLGGAGATVAWTAGGFVPNGQSLILSAATADSTIDFRNGIDFGAANRAVLVNDGTAAVDAVLSGVLSGTGGGLVKSGSGTLILSANNTYTGTTTISAGVLQVGTGGTTGTLGVGNVTNSGQLVINRSDALALGQTISSSGVLRQSGSGTTILTANNTYTGGTVISAGTLQVGNGGTTGALGGGAVSNNAVLAINRSNALTVSSVINGTGSLHQDGVGTTTLTGLNTFSGSVELNAGVLAVANLQNGGINSNLGASANAAANLDFDGGTLRYTGVATSTDRNFLIEDGGATLDASGSGILTWTGAPSYDVANQTRSLTLTGTSNGSVFAGALTDNGAGALSVTKTGASRWILAGNNSYSGTTTISTGTLQIGNGGTSGTLGSGAVVNNATLTFLRSDALNVASSISGTGTLNQSGTGTTLLNGSAAAALTNVNLGILAVNGALVTPTLTLANTATLDVRGTVEAAGANPTTITGSTGVNTVLVATGATLRATGDLGNGSDLLDVSGTVNTGAGTLSLGTGDDTLTIHDGTNIVGTVAGGTGVNTFNTDIAGVASLGTVSGFQTLLKTGVGTLNINGPAASSFTTVSAGAGTLSIAATGSITGVVTSTVASGATLSVSGSLLGSGASNTLSVAGTVSGTGTIDFGAGDDVLTLTDGAAITAVIRGGTQTTSDSVVLNNAAPLTLDSATISGFERLTKQNTGVATLTGVHSYSTAASINAGVLRVAGELDTPSVALGDSSTLEVQGIVQSLTATPTVLSGSVGVNTVVIAAGATLRATGDLGNGSDLLDVAGTLDTGAGTLSLGIGDDTLTIHDDTNIVGTVAGGSGVNTFNTDIATAASLGAATGFQTLLKTGVGTLNINGPAVSTFTAVTVNAGTLNVAATGAASGVSTTAVATGASLNVDGSYLGSTGNDTMTIDGTVAGSGTIDLGAGDDVLTLNDGAVITANTGGGTQPAADSIVLNNAAALTLGTAAISGFEQLTKQNTGVATLTGAQAYAAGVIISTGTLSVAGTLDAPTITLGDASTLEVLGTVEAAGPAPAIITGSAGINSVFVHSGAILRASGDLAAGSDLLDVAGTLDTGAGTLTLGDDDDTLTIHDGTSIVGTVNGGAGTNTFNADIATVADLGAVIGFQTLLKTGVGTLNLTGPANSIFDTVLVNAGVLHVGASATVDPATTVVAAGATLQVDGSYLGTAGDDTMSVAGTISGGGTIDLGAGDDELTLNDGALLSAVVNGGAQAAGDVVVLNNATAFAFDDTRTSGFELLRKQNGGVATLTGSQSYAAVSVNAGTLSVSDTLNSSTLTVADNSVVEVLGTLQATGSTPTTITGSTGANTLRVGSGAILRAIGDLGAGADLVDVTGSLDTAAGILTLGDGDDTLTIHDGASINGIVAGGAGTNTFNPDIAASAALGAVNGFQTLLKTGAGTLNLNGPAASTFTTVTINAGTVNVAAAGSVDGATITTIAAGATLNVDGSYLGSASADTLSVAGTVSGAGTIDLGDGDDVLALSDGALLNAAVNGGTHSAGDTIAINNSSAFALDANRTTGFETLNKQGAGTLTLSGMPTFTNGININGGTLASSGTLTSGLVNIAAAGTLASSGVIVGDVTNAGVLNMGGGTPFSSLTIRGDYIGAGGRLDMRVALGDDASPTDRLTIDGGSASGTTLVRVVNQNGLGARTSGSGIQLIAATNGATTATGAFTLDSPVMAGAYSYDLFHGTAADTDPQGWYLRSLQLVRDVASVSTAIVPLAHLYGLSVVGTLHEREGADVGATCSGNTPRCQWGRVLYRSGSHEGGGTAANGANFDYDVTGVQIGTDIYENVDENRTSRAGLYLSMGPASGYVDRDDGTRAGTAQSLASTIGAYWTRRHPASYVDTTVLGTYFSRIDLEPRDDEAAETDGWAVAASIEAGHNLRLGTEWNLQPQAQVIVQHLEQSDSRTSGTTIRFSGTDTIVARAGLELGVSRPRGKDDSRYFSGWLRANYWSELSGSAETTLTAPSAPSTVFRTDFDEDWVEVSAGIAAQVNEHTSVHASVTTNHGVNGSDSQSVNASLGLRVQW